MGCSDLSARLGEDLGPVLGGSEEGGDAGRGERGNAERPEPEQEPFRCFLTSFVSPPPPPPAAAEQHHRVRVLSGGVPTAAGGVLVPVLLLLSAVPGGPGVSSGSDREPAHRHGLSAPEGERTACRGRRVPVGVNEEVTFPSLCFRASCHTCCRASPWITCTFPTTSTCSQRRRRQSQKVKRQPPLLV